MLIVEALNLVHATWGIAVTTLLAQAGMTVFEFFKTGK
jgi:hypothetical protein